MMQIVIFAKRKTGSRSLMGPKTLPTIWDTYMKLMTKYKIFAINSCWKKCDEKCAYMFNVHKNQLLFADLVGFNTHWTYMHIFVTFFSATIDDRDLIFGHKLLGIWRVQKRFPQYGVPIWSLWPNIRFLSSIVAEKNATKNVIPTSCLPT
jgi:hypothetical protein